LPLFTVEDADRAMTLLQPIGYERPVTVIPGLTAEFINAGHLLGSAYARVRVEQPAKTILFGGDLGRYSRPVLPDPSPIAEADVLLVESTYGDKVHPDDDNGLELARIIKDTVHRNGKLIIPAFALGRVEELLYWIRSLEERREIPTAAGLCRQSDGVGRACSCTRSARTSSMPKSNAQMTAICCARPATCACSARPGSKW
jgi:metallo-beta-lactamase family protein